MTPTKFEMNYWEIIADNLSKLVGVGAASQRLIQRGELWSQIAVDKASQPRVITFRKIGQLNLLKT